MGFRTMGIYFTFQNCTLKNSSAGRFYVTCFLPQLGKKSKWLLSIEWYNRNNFKKEGGIREQSPAKKKKRGRHKDNISSYITYKQTKH